MSWSSGALHARIASACGGLTAVTPVHDHSDWIADKSDDLRRFTLERGGGPGATDWMSR